MANIALIVGVDEYDVFSNLSGCVNDAKAVAHLLLKNEDDSPNFDCRIMLSSEKRITRASLRSAITDLFSKNGIDVALLFFAGHGAYSDSFGGSLVTQDGAKDDEGIPLSWIVQQANESKATEKVLIFDSCHAGAVDRLFSSSQSVALGSGVSILAACRDNEVAVERGGRGLFSSLICDALDGGGADVVGATTVASIYAYVDEVLAGWDQRPLLKANVAKLQTIRKSLPAVSPEKLRKLTQLFSDANQKLPLDPSYEPTAEPHHDENETTFGILQSYRAARLLQPDGEDHLYFAAMNSKSCSLTPLGRFYWHRVNAGKV